jgi:hypothetical protein
MWKLFRWYHLEYITKLTSWSWALLENPPIVQLLKNFPAFYETRWFITVFTRALHWSLSWARSIQSIPSHPFSLRSILILCTHLRLNLPSGLFPSGFLTKILYSFLFSTIRVTCPSHPPWLDHSNYIWRRVQLMTSSLCNFLAFFFKISPVSYWPCSWLTLSPRRWRQCFPPKR